MNTLFPGDAVLYWGRWLSLACTVGALALAYALGRRAGQRSAAGFVAFALVAVNPMVFEHATLARSYAPWLLVGFWHAYGLLRLHETDAPTTRTKLSVAASALLLPWIHYLSIPLLFIEAALLAVFNRERARRALLFILLPTVVSVLPLLPLMLGDSSRRHPGEWRQMVSVALGSLSGGWPMAMFIVAPWLVIALRVDWPVDPRRRALLAGLLGAVGAATAAAPLALVRTPTALFAVPFLAPLLAEPPRQRRWFVNATVAVWLLIGAVGVVAIARGGRDASRDGVKQFAQLRESWDRVRAGRPVHVTPSYQVPALYYTFERRSIAEAPQGRCPRGAMCVEHGGTVFMGFDGSGDELHGVVVSFHRSPPVQLDRRCKPIERRDNMHIFDCP
jgi:hypothetical protein